jgi:formate hydrogenlyase transcriptional activator
LCDLRAYRLNVFPIRVPALRERRDDIPLLVAAALAKLSRRLGRPLTGVSAASLERLRNHAYPGNVRELHNLLERAAILATGPLLEVELLQPGRDPMAAVAPMRSLQAHEREHIAAALAAARWRIAGPDGAAAALGLHPNTLRSRMKRLGIPTRSEARHELQSQPSERDLR